MTKPMPFAVFDLEIGARPIATIQLGAACAGRRTSVRPVAGGAMAHRGTTRPPREPAATRWRPVLAFFGARRCIGRPTQPIISHSAIGTGR